ncbi:hypothetical protein HKD37_06G017112 [Glycine soja]
MTIVSLSMSKCELLHHKTLIIRSYEPLSCIFMSSLLNFVGIRVGVVVDDIGFRAGEARLTSASSKGGKCAESPPTFIYGKRQKNRRKSVMKNIPDSGVVFTFEEGRQKRGSCSYVPSIKEETRPT